MMKLNLVSLLFLLVKKLVIKMFWVPSLTSN